MKRNKLFDSGLSIQEERKSLIYALLQHIQQHRGLLYYIIAQMKDQSVDDSDIHFVIDDESNYLNILNKMNQANDKDPEKLSNTLWSYHRVRRTKRKFSHFVREAFNKFSEMVDRLIKSGVLNRLFGQFDFFSEQDRDSHSPRSAHLRKLRHRPAKCGQRIDDFGEVKWDFEFARD